MTAWFNRMVWTALFCLLAGAPEAAIACAACFGRSDSKLAQGMNLGIFTLLLLVLGVLGGFAAFFIYLARRSAGMGSGHAAESTPRLISGERRS